MSKDVTLQEALKLSFSFNCAYENSFFDFILMKNSIIVHQQYRQINTRLGYWCARSIENN
jgi:hypothetical protein